MQAANQNHRRQRPGADASFDIQKFMTTDIEQVETEQGNQRAVRLAALAARFSRRFRAGAFLFSRLICLSLLMASAF